MTKRNTKFSCDLWISANACQLVDHSEQATGWYTMLEGHLALPFEATMLGVLVNVVALEVRGDNGIVAICTRGRERQSVPILDLSLPSPRPEGVEWIEAYRHWVEG